MDCKNFFYFWYLWVIEKKKSTWSIFCFSTLPSAAQVFARRWKPNVAGDFERTSPLWTLNDYYSFYSWWPQMRAVVWLQGWCSTIKLIQAGFRLYFSTEVILKHFMALNFKLRFRMRHLIVTFFVVFLRMGPPSYESFVYNHHALEKK